MKIDPGTFYITTMGCAKNLVDSSSMESLLNIQGFISAAAPSRAEFIIVNTCGFIHDARTESLSVLIDLARRKKRGQKLIAAGCLSQRYQEALLAQVPGIDGMIGTRDLADIIPLFTHLNQNTAGPLRPAIPEHESIHFISGLPGYTIQGRSSYLKIADGCRRSCAFCAIPGIKGGLVSRSKEDILKDALALQKTGIQEINLIAQDVTDYGQDLGIKDGLPDLIETLLPVIPDVPWVRLLYTFPGYVSDRLIDLMVNSPQLLPYLDMPLQHADPVVLHAMRRPSDVDWVRQTIAKMRARIPGLVIRTTFIVGFPTETEASFQTLLQFLREMQFDHVGVFTYSPEEDTPAASLGDPIPQSVKEARREELMKLQAGISLRKNQDLKNHVLPMLVEGVDKDNNILIGRTYRDAPEIDGLMIAEGKGKIGDMLSVRVKAAMLHDLFGEIIPPSDSAN
ncbi:MAG: 30S ribosomal protein S12 methylthiotransferase RimO [Anaerolineaceae bacterium]|nr:30S ribosomal protein S12 methylthiotransferase RimO [Anaerolineaceae bacterium]